MSDIFCQTAAENECGFFCFVFFRTNDQNMQKPNQTVVRISRLYENLHKRQLMVHAEKNLPGNDSDTNIKLKQDRIQSEGLK